MGKNRCFLMNNPKIAVITKNFLGINDFSSLKLILLYSFPKSLMVFAPTFTESHAQKFVFLQNQGQFYPKIDISRSFGKVSRRLIQYRNKNISFRRNKKFFLQKVSQKINIKG